MPNVIEIEKGDTIIWKNLERGVVHTVTSTSGLFDEKLLNCTYFEDGVGICGGHPKATFSYTFEEFGTYNYNCKIHSWMNGIVKILEFGGEAEIQIHGFAGSMFIDKSQYVVTAGKAAEIKIYGGVKTWSSSGGERVFFTITYPDGSTDEQSSPIKRSNGEYKFPLNVNYDEVGTYIIQATFGMENIGTANFVVVSKSIPEGTCSRPFIYSKVVSSGAIIPALAPASILILHIVIRPSILKSAIAFPAYSIT